ncbi:sas6 [Symbiodinium pilosum]|uniref:Sas6 protein n=1 Tax=Symbiodinium pilosum TaxID=2952 RepID=A0A812WPF1_SYMPI|nr:sas6 [Symbiodinium pilosum]
MALPLQMKQVEAKLGKAVETVKRLLHAERVPQFAGNVHHQYEDKYLLVERVTCLAAASQLSCLGMLGLTHEHLQTMRNWAAEGSSVSLRFKSKEACSFLREETREEEDPRKHVEERSIGGMVRSAVTSKVVTKITEYFWQFEASYSLEAFRGVGSDSADRLVLASYTGATELKTTTKSPAPHPEARVPAINQEVNITWLVQALSSEPVTPQFQINRNPEVQKAVEHFNSFAYWTQYVVDYFHHLRTVQPRKPDESTFCPVLSTGDGNCFLAEELRCLKDRCTSPRSVIDLRLGLVRAAEISTAVVLLHSRDVCDAWKKTMEYVEGMLRQQLSAAIGNEIGPAEFAAYMQFHYRKLFLDKYQPKQFCFPVRRSERHAPEGTISLDEEATGLIDGGSIRSPVVTISQCSSNPVAMSFDLSASTTVTFSGQVHLHGWLSHSFSGQNGCNLFLTSRARQFSSMVVLVGRVTSATTFDPTYAAIVQNKDELSIPLELSVIPTPKEFKDAIASLSPEQQAFAKAFRAMQLESTLFGVAVVQIKPQLEKLLNLAVDSLTKEIKLTQDIMELFLKYQIPSDLLSFDEEPVAGSTFAPPARPAERVATVKGHVKAMLDMIDEEKRLEIEERRRQEEYLRPQLMELHRGELEDCLDGAMHERFALEECKKEAEEEGLKLEVKKKRKKCKMQSREKEARASEVMIEMTADPCSAQEPAQSSDSTTQKDNSQAEPGQQGQGSGPGANSGATRDYAQVPQEMDEQFEKLDPDSALRPTIITPGSVWSKKSQKSLLAQPSTAQLLSDDQKREKDAAFDLLDAITKSGALELSDATLHIVIAATHCFDKTVMECAIQDNVNPIERVERSSLIMASTIHQEPAKALVNENNVPRLSKASPQMFLEDGE